MNSKTEKSFPENDRESVLREIEVLRKERKAVLLAHNYQLPEIQDIADFTGDSLELSMRAAKTDAEVIVFCGVLFMAETAAILSPAKTVLLPRLDAGCPLADMITPEALQNKFAELGDLPTVIYVNSPASVKALSTICCTSANSVEVVESLAEDEIMMGPDRNLALYTASKTGKKIHPWQGACPVHDQVTADDARAAKAAHPEALLLAHPECRPEVLALADVVAGTAGMLKFVKRSAHQSFIIGTEEGHIYPLQKANPDKTFFKMPKPMVCRDMKRIRLTDVLASLQTMTHKIKLSENIRLPAYQAVQRMLEVTGNSKRHEQKGGRNVKTRIN